MWTMEMAVFLFPTSKFYEPYEISKSGIYIYIYIYIYMPNNIKPFKMVRRQDHHIRMANRVYESCSYCVNVRIVLIFTNPNPIRIINVSIFANLNPTHLLFVSGKSRIRPI